MLNILNKIDFKLLILVGDVYQIESIQFGNWFSLIKSFIKQTAVFELETPYRTKNAALLSLWDKVRKNSDDIAEAITQNNYSAPLDKTIFKPQSHDEIVLCLNYDGLYGINNVNRFLQSSNVNPAVQWQESAYKVGDPILFTEAERFRPVIYNNLKGWIKKIELNEEFIQFDVLLDRPLSEFDTLDVDDIEWIEDSTVRFKVFDLPNSSDEDDDSYNTNIPFQVAYAVSIHKAQGLEYDSVKIVITDSNEEDITHSIFYTAITRARNNLKIFWSPETQQSILKRLTVKVNNKDAHLLKSRHANLI
jgi:ATP-dependent exoDNAse (exonuclease V) alpha subunit